MQRRATRREVLLLTGLALAVHASLALAAVATIGLILGWHLVSTLWLSFEQSPLELLKVQLVQVISELYPLSVFAAWVLERRR